MDAKCNSSEPVIFLSVTWILNIMIPGLNTRNLALFSHSPHLNGNNYFNNSQITYYEPLF